MNIQIQGNQYRHKVNFSLEDKAKLGDLEKICESIKEKTCLYHFNLEDNPILQKSSSRKKWKTYDKRDFYDYALIKKHVSSNELINYIRTDVRKIKAHLKIVTEIILENMPKEENKFFFWYIFYYRFLSFHLLSTPTINYF